ncbi:MAG: putative sulfate/molybdate transporter [Bacillota bacterium]|nr:putative sulfate/molybdate transporter [Bacillota bacterium]
MRIRGFEFSMRELAGSMGDFGTLFPLAVGYIVYCGMNPAGFLVMMGLTNIVTGIVYRLPMPLEPMKALAVMAIAQRWPPSLIYASAFGSGLIWLLLGVTGLIDRVSVLTPRSVTRGIQVALGLLLGIEGLKAVSTSWVLAACALAIVALLRNNRCAPASVVLMVMGLVLVFTPLSALVGNATLDPAKALPSFTPLPLTTFSPGEVWKAMVLAGFAQVPLTLTNAVIAASALISRYFPDRPVPERRLAINMGIMNVVVPFFGGMPMCHGAGGLAGQYYFGARTGGTNIIEGTLEICMGLFFATTIHSVLGAFPQAIIGAMMLAVGFELARFALELRGREVGVACATVVASVALNMAAGYGVGLAVHYLFQRPSRKAAGHVRTGSDV